MVAKALTLKEGKPKTLQVPGGTLTLSYQSDQPSDSIIYEPPKLWRKRNENQDSKWETKFCQRLVSLLYDIEDMSNPNVRGSLYGLGFSRRETKKLNSERIDDEWSDLVRIVRLANDFEKLFTLIENVMLLVVPVKLKKDLVKMATEYNKYRNQNTTDVRDDILVDEGRMELSSLLRDDEEV